MKWDSTLYSNVLDFFSSRSISVFWLVMTLSFSLSLLRCSWRKVSFAPSWLSNCWSTHFSVEAIGERCGITLSYHIYKPATSIVVQKMGLYQFCWTALSSSDGHEVSVPTPQSVGAASDHQLGLPAHRGAELEDSPWADPEELAHLLCGKQEVMDRFGLNLWAGNSRFCDWKNIILSPTNCSVSHTAWHKESVIQTWGWLTAITGTSSLF